MILVNLINKVLFITLDQIAATGKVSVFDNTDTLLVEQTFERSNFEKLTLPECKGDIKIKIEYDNKKYLKKIYVN